MGQRSIHGQFRKYIIAAAVVPILILAVFAYVTLTEAYEASVERDIQNVVQTLGTVIAEFDASNRSLVEVFAQHPAVMKAEAAAIEEAAVREAIHVFDTGSNSVSSMALGLADGRMFTRLQEQLPEGYDPRQRPWYLDAVADPDTVVLSEPYENAAAPGTFSITYSKALIAPGTGEVIGVVGSDASLMRLDKVLPSLRVGVGGTVLIVDEAGDVLTGQDTRLKRRLMESPESVAGLRTHRQANLFGDDYQITLQEEPITHWRILILFPTQELMSGSSRILLSVAFSVLMLLGGAWILSNRMEQGLTKPIDLLKEGLGDFELDSGTEQRFIGLPPGTPLEVQAIGDAANAMMERIRGQSLELLEKKQEINAQCMEITALYEETAALNDSLNDLVDQLKYGNRMTIEALSNAIEANDHYTKGHCVRVTELALRIGQAAGLGSGELEDLELASLLHDVGKVGVPSQVLNKEETLTAEECLLIRRHPALGAGIIEKVPFLQAASEIILQHHERMDGTGYPHGLLGEEIRLPARILSIADAFDAMTTARPYRKAPLSIPEALAELDRGKGSQFDGPMVELCRQVASGGEGS